MSDKTLFDNIASKRTELLIKWIRDKIEKFKLLNPIEYNAMIQTYLHWTGRVILDIILESSSNIKYTVDVFQPPTINSNHPVIKFQMTHSNKDNSKSYIYKNSYTIDINTFQLNQNRSKDTIAASFDDTSIKQFLVSMDILEYRFDKLFFNLCKEELEDLERFK